MERATEYIISASQPSELYFFGSIVTQSFDEQSDIDVVAVFPDVASANEGRKAIYGAKRSPELPPVEVICVGQREFDHKSTIGGVCYTARREGRKVKLS